MPNQVTAKGTHARGDRLRKKLIMGKNASLGIRRIPIQSPMGTASTTDRLNPMPTLNKEVMEFLYITPFSNLSLNPSATSPG